MTKILTVVSAVAAVVTLLPVFIVALMAGAVFAVARDGFVIGLEWWEEL